MSVKTSYVWRDGEMIEINSEDQLRERSRQIISDEMPATVHPVTGKTHESKSAFRKETRNLGLTELGNDVQNTQAKNYKIHDRKVFEQCWREAKQTVGSRK